MEALNSIITAFEEAQNEYEELKKEQAPSFVFTDKFGLSEIESPDIRRRFPYESILSLADNVEFMDYLLKTRNMEGCIDFIYIDPPFFTGADYNATIWLSGKDSKKAVKTKVYRDSWGSDLAEFINMIALRLMLMKDLLKDTGSIAVHLDHHAVHYIKIIMDEIFGPENFVNELIWSYKSGGTLGKGFAKKHDTILVYSKTENFYYKLQKEKSYNRGGKPYRFKNVEEFQDEDGWYTMVKRKDVISVNMVGRTSAERTGYATQKPEELLDILLASFTPEGGLAADFFAGAASLAAAAQKRGIKTISCDLSPNALNLSIKRLAELGADFSVIKSCKYNEPLCDAELFYDGNALRVLSYKRDIDNISLSKKERSAFDKALEDNPLALADFYALGRKQGECFKADSYSKLNGGMIFTDALSEMIKIYDVLGGTKEIRISEIARNE